jgi:hypothetical protein
MDLEKQLLPGEPQQPQELELEPQEPTHQPCNIQHYILWLIIIHLTLIFFMLSDLYTLYHEQQQQILDLENNLHLLKIQLQWW